MKSVFINANFKSKHDKTVDPVTDSTNSVKAKVVKHTSAKPKQSKTQSSVRTMGKAINTSANRQSKNSSNLIDCETQINNAEKIARWLDTSVESSSILSNTVVHEPECMILCFSRKAVRQQRKAGVATVETEKNLSSRMERKQKQTSVQGGVRPKTSTRTLPHARPASEVESDGEFEFTSVSKQTNRVSTCKDRIKLRSGFLDKPKSSILYKHEWPHMNQDPHYVTESLTFNQLNFSQFVGESAEQ